MIDRERKHVCALGMLLAALGAGFLLGWNGHFLYALVAGIYFVTSGYLLNRALLPIPAFHSFLLAPFSASLPLFIAGAGIYFLYKIDTLAILFLLCVPALSVFASHTFSRPSYKERIEDPLDSRLRKKIFSIAVFTVFSFSLASLWMILFHSQTTASILGPWAAMQKPIIIPYMLAGIALVGILLTHTRISLALLSLCVFFFSGFSVLLMVFPLGFGFDPHLHQATERIIAEKGLILPKQFYYLGQYAFVAFLSKLLAMSAQNIDKLFIPLVSALSIPISAFTCARVYALSKKYALVFALFCLLIPFGYATLTVPWNIASLFTLIFSFFSIVYIRLKYKGILIFLTLLCLGALSIHPLAGLPLLGVLLCMFAYTFLQHTTIQRLFIPAIVICSGISVPLALLINSRVSSQLSIALTPPSLKGIQQLWNLLLFHANTRFSAPLDFIHIIYQNGGIILLFLAVCGIMFTVWKASFPWKEALFPVLGAGICIMNVLILEEFFSFPSLISYEQHVYADRVLSLAMFFLIPPVLLSLVLFLKKILHHPLPMVRMIWLLFFAGMFGGSFYLSYPGNDVYRPFHGWNVSQSDIKAVRYIQDTAHGEPYIVLSNQVVAAAAIKEFGFQTYFTIIQGGKLTQLFYYPIPTSSPLYQFFLDMEVYPSEKTIQSAMRLANVRQAYFVITQYEDRYKTLVEQTKEFAMSVKKIDGGRDVIFGFKNIREE